MNGRLARADRGVLRQKSYAPGELPGTGVHAGGLALGATLRTGGPDPASAAQVRVFIVSLLSVENELRRLSKFARPLLSSESGSKMERRELTHQVPWRACYNGNPFQSIVLFRWFQKLTCLMRT